jgi:hypothetical protein
MSAVGDLLCLSMTARADIAYPVGELSRFRSYSMYALQSEKKQRRR